MKRLYLLLVIFIIIGLLIYFPGRKMARAHVNYITATTDHPLLCISCHLYTQKDGILAKFINADYLSPITLTNSNDGKQLYVVAQDANALLVVDAESHKVLKKIMVGNKPHSVVVDKAGKTAYVTNQWADNISVIDLQTMEVTDTLTTSGGPAGIDFSKDGTSLYVVNSYSSTVSVIDLKSGEEKKRLNAGNNPTGIKVSPAGKDIIVTSRRANLAPYKEPLVSELTLLDDNTRRISKRQAVDAAYLMENVDFTPTGDLAIFTLIRPKNLVPSIQVERGFMMTHGIGILEIREGGNLVQLLLDEPNAYYPDPFDVVISLDGKKAFVSHSGVNCISVVNIDSVRSIIAESTPEELKTYSNHLGISSRYVTKRIITGANPKGLSLSPDGKLLYVAEMLEDRIAIISTETLETIGTIDLGGPDRITVARHGRRLLNNAGHTFQNQYSCYTCHPDTHEDGLVYNMASIGMGRNVTNTQSLRDISETAPYKWNGKNQTVYKQDGIRFSTVLTRTEPFSYKDLDAITAFILTGIPYPPNLQYNPSGELTESQQKGKKFFERSVDKAGSMIPENNRCITCHPAPFYTNRQPFDVSTLAATDDSMLFDTPHLNNIYASPPYLHDGRAMTLEEIWTLYGTDDKHGVTSDMTKMELNYLIDYLLTLSSPDYKRTNYKVDHASFKPY